MGTTVRPVFMNFTSGELSEKVGGRIDLDRYFNGAQSMMNWTCLPQGGARPGPGTRFMAAQGDETRRARMIPFSYDDDQNYALEFGHQYLRMFTNDGQVGSATSSVSMLLHCDGSEGSTSFPDSGYYGHSFTVNGDAKVSSTLGKFSGALRCNGTGYLSLSDHTAFDFSGGVFTLEFFLYHWVTNDGGTIYFQPTDANNYVHVYVTYSAPYHTLHFRIVATGTTVVEMTCPEVTRYAYHHFMITENGNNYYLFRDGELVDSETSTSRMANYTGNIEIGRDGSTGYLKGYLDEIRALKGSCAHTTNFSPPTAPYPGGATPYEIVSPYDEEDLDQLRYKEGDRELYLFHPDYPTKKLVRLDAINWEFQDVVITGGPFGPETTNPTITPSASALGGDRVTNGAFTTDSGWTKGTEWSIYGGSAHKIIGGTSVLAQSIGAATGKVFKITYTVIDVGGETVSPWVQVSIGATTGTNRAAPGTYTEYLTCGGPGNLQFGVGDAATYANIDNVSAIEVVTLASSSPLFDVAHEGSIWRIKHGSTWGEVQITGVVSSTSAYALVTVALGGTGASDAWEEPAWSGLDGWPRNGCFHEGRLLYLSSYEHPNTAWGSKSGEGNYGVHTPGTNDDDAFILTASKLRTIRWAQSLGQLILGASNDTAAAVGPNDDPITVTAPPRIKCSNGEGSADIDAVEGDGSVIYVQRARKKILDMAYDYLSDTHHAIDLTELADHLFEAGVRGLAVQKQPIKVIWVWTSDGELIGGTYDRAAKLMGWHRHPIGGDVEDVSVLRRETDDQVWLTVKRDINGTEHRYIEVLDQDMCVLSGLRYSGAPVSSVSGLGHLDGEEVYISGDGAVHPPKTVASSAVALDSPASEIVVGLPMDNELVTMPPEVQVGGGSTQSLQKRWSRIAIRVVDTFGLEVNGQAIPARKAEDEMDLPPEAITGDVKVINLGYDTSGAITLKQPLPVPAHVVMITGLLVIGDM